MDDLIRRQDAINALLESYEDNMDVEFILEKLPSAQKKGHWVDGKRMKMDGTFYWFRQCSACDYERNDDDSDKDTNFCPNCGADMREER